MLLEHYQAVVVDQRLEEDIEIRYNIFWQKQSMLCKLTHFTLV